MKQVFDKEDANTVVILSNSFSKTVIAKIYFYLEPEDSYSDMLLYVAAHYSGMIGRQTSIQFASVIEGYAILREY